MSKMSALWYEARDAIDSGKHLKASTRTLHKYLAELSIVQPWESEQSAWRAVDKKHTMIGKLEKEIARRKKKQLALIRKTFYSLAVGIAVYICGRLIYDKIFPGNPIPQKEQKQLLPSIQDQTTSNQQNQPGISHGKENAQQPPKKLKRGG